MDARFVSILAKKKVLVPILLELPFLALLLIAYVVGEKYPDQWNNPPLGSMINALQQLLWLVSGVYMIPAFPLHKLAPNYPIVNTLVFWGVIGFVAGAWWDRRRTPV